MAASACTQAASGSVMSSSDALEECGVPSEADVADIVLHIDKLELFMLRLT